MVLVCLETLIPLARGFFFFFYKKGVCKPILCEICHCLSGSLRLESSFVSMATL